MVSEAEVKAAQAAYQDARNAGKHPDSLMWFALEAAERVRGERVVYASEGRRTLEIYNGVHLEFQETLRHKDAIVIRKAVK